MFHASGQPAQVGEFINQVAAALADLPLDRLEVERRVLRAEAESGGGGLAPVWTFHHGNRGPALDFLDNDFLRLTGPVVRDFADRHFTRGRAALAVTGALPSNLDFTLPDGPAASWPDLPERALAGPSWVPAPAAGIALSLAHRSLDPAANMVMHLLRERLENTLRHTAGTTYSVDLDGMQVGERVRSVVTLDASDGEERTAARTVWQTLV